MTDATTGARHGEIEHLDRLAERFEEDARDVRSLARTIRRLRAGRADGRAWHDMIATDRSRVLHLVERVSRRVGEGGAALRRLLVRGLRTEGSTVPAIAQLLGVSHQRASVLLRDGPGRAVAPGREPRAAED